MLEGELRRRRRRAARRDPDRSCMQAARPAAAARRHLDPVRPDQRAEPAIRVTAIRSSRSGHVRARRLLHRRLVARKSKPSPRGAATDRRRAARGCGSPQRERRLAQRLARHVAGVHRERAADRARARRARPSSRRQASDPRRRSAGRANDDEVDPFPPASSTPSSSEPARIATVARRSTVAPGWTLARAGRAGIWATHPARQSLPGRARRLDLDANVWVPPNDRARLEPLCR